MKVGTIFESSHVEIYLWLQAIFLMPSSKGVSSNQLHRALGITLETAWLMSRRIREAMSSGNLSPMGGVGSIVADETISVKLPRVQGGTEWLPSPKLATLRKESLIRRIKKFRKRKANSL